MSLREAVQLYFFDKHHRLGELEVDAVIKETHELRATATEHPVESGSTIVDHIHSEPVTLQIEGIISNTPTTFIGITAFKSASNYLKEQSNDLSELAFKKLQAIFAARQPITIATSLKDYTDMVLESLSIERTAHTSASLHFRATAKQIRIVNQARIKVPQPKSERAKPKVNLGKQDTAPASPTVLEQMASKSFLKSLIGLGR